MAKYRVRPSVEVEAFRWTVDQVPQWWKDLQGVMVQVDTTIALLPSGDNAKPGDYIVRDHLGEVLIVDRKRFESDFIPADEPVFEVLGRDQFCQGTIVHWIERARAAGVPEAKIESALRRYDEVVAFQSDHPDRVKRPD